MHDIVDFNYFNYNIENKFIVIVEMPALNFDILSFYLSEIYSYYFWNVEFLFEKIYLAKTSCFVYK